MSDAAPWFRFYRSAGVDPKLQRLPPALFKRWVNLLCLTDDSGHLPSIDDIGYRLHLNSDKVVSLLSEMERIGLFDRDGDHYTAHKWGTWQRRSDVSTKRVKRFRERQETVSETAPEQNRTEQNRTDRRGGPSAAPPLDRLLAAEKPPDFVGAVVDLWKVNCGITLEQTQKGHLGKVFKRYPWPRGAELQRIVMSEVVTKASGDKVNALEGAIRHANETRGGARPNRAEERPVQDGAGSGRVLTAKEAREAVAQRRLQAAGSNVGDEQPREGDAGAGP